jgi:hypothetical protein
MSDGTSWQASDLAISEVIGFILILALIITTLSLYTIYVVPVMGRDDEITQLNYIEEQFTDYKMMLDGVWSAHAVNGKYPAPSLVIPPPVTRTTIRLGTGNTRQIGGSALALFHPVPSSAILAINTTGDTFDIDSSSYHSVKTTMVDFPITVTALEYRSNNYYWIQQRYSYELGGVFLSQNDGIINRISPLISMTSSDNKSVVVNVVPVQITATNASLGGAGRTVRIETIQRVLPAYNISAESYRDNQWVNLSYTSADYATAAMWLGLFKNSALREGLDTAAYKTGIGYDSATKKSTAFIYITGSNPDPRLNKVSLYVQRAEFNLTLSNVATEIE